MRGFLALLCAFAIFSKSALGVPQKPLSGTRDEPICQDDEFIPHEDCRFYYQCDNGNPIMFECNDGLFWNPSINACDHPSQVPECVGGTRPPVGTTPPVTSTPTTTTPTTASPTTTTLAPTTDTSAGPTTLAPTPTTTTDPSIPICEGNELLPHHNCYQYYQCSNGIPYLQNCSGVLYFNPRTGLCDFPSEVPECVGGTRPPVTPTTAMPTTTTRITTTTEEIPETTHSEEPTTTTRITTTTTEEIPETTNSGEPGPCIEDGVYKIPIPNNCSGFIQCVNKEAHPMRCAAGLLYDPALQNCNIPETVRCTQTPCWNHTIVYNSPYPSDCTKYYICAMGIAVEQSCAPGTLFDLVLRTCVLADQATCHVRFSAQKIVPKLFKAKNTFAQHSAIIE